MIPGGMWPPRTRPQTGLTALGQEKQVTVYRLITKDTIEENILNLQEAKRALADQIVTGEGISLSDLTAKELLDCIGEISEDSV